MKYSLAILLFFALLFSNCLHAQLEKVIVETYYVSDANDSIVTGGDKLDSGSTTYRIFVDMLPGYKLKKIYGDVNHVLKIASTTPFFNNSDRGQVLGKDVPGNHLNENTVALDSWLTLGQVTKSSVNTYFGVLKIEDTDSSFIGGVNNDLGMLVNTNPAAGIVLTMADGMDTLVNLPTNWNPYGLDSTIFDTINKSATYIVSNIASLQNSGVMGVDLESNQVIVAQLTTKGNISFEINLEITDSNGNSIFYVANDSVLLPGEVYNRYLKYPFNLLCGCPDPNYLEFIGDRDCDVLDSCKTLVVLGCTDILACNYDPSANYNIQSMCCYPGYCNDRDISLVCPKISNSVGFIVYPNPAKDNINLQISSGDPEDMSYSMYDYFGTKILEKKLGLLSGNINEQINLSNLNTGLYLVRVSIGNTTDSKLFMKN